jgi:nucleoid DNA-binding protein
MSRVKTDWRSGGLPNYKCFCKAYPNIKLTYKEWKEIIYSFNEGFRDEILQTGDRLKLPSGLGEFTINKKKRKQFKTVNGEEKINLPIDWKKTKEKGKVIYNFNYHTEGYFFGWHWFKDSARFKHAHLWYFKPFRVTSRLITTYLNSDDKYQHIYREWMLRTLTT